MQKSQHSRRYQRLLKILRSSRKRAGLTQLEVARHFGAYMSFVNKVETGERRIDVVELADFCKLYGVKLSAILKQAEIE